jgi:3-oxoacyl-[acyl-carrier protein] reductase
VDLGLAGKFALVTGGSHGIGLSTAESLAREGCNVAICSRDRGRLDEAVSRIENHGVLSLGIECDVLSEADIDRVIKHLVDAWPTLHILVNNVGGGGRWGKENVEETPLNVWQEVYDKNAGAAMRFTRAVIPGMRAQKWGRVVTVASIYGKEGGGRPWFNMAKSAEISLMKTLAMTPYLVRDGITFNTVVPGGIYIPGTGWDKEKAADPEGFKRMLDEHFPLGRMGDPAEVGRVVTFVCSEQASLVNGAAITVDGGESHSF